MLNLTLDIRVYTLVELVVSFLKYLHSGKDVYVYKCVYIYVLYFFKS